MTVVETPSTAATRTSRRNVWGRLYHGETRVDFMGRKWWGLGLSGVAIVVTIVSLIFSGLNLGLDFEGGVQWEVPAANLTQDEARAVLTGNGVDAADAKIVTVTGERRRPAADPGRRADHRRPHRRSSTRSPPQSGEPISEISSNSVTSSWGRRSPRRPFGPSSCSSSSSPLFIAWRFEWRMALGAIAAMLHDVLISVGVYSVLQLEVTPATVIAFLTILGFSLYDTIVVFDKVDENTAALLGRAAAVRRHHQRVDEPGADALAEHEPRRGAAGAVAAGRSAPGSSARSRCASSPSPCSSA